jgi:hypothetical protein
MTMPVDSAAATVTAQAPDVTGAAKRLVANASGTADPGPIKVGNVVLRGVTVALDTDVGQQFIADCCRNTEGLLSDSDIKSKWTLSDEDWQRLADNAPLLQAVRAERERRIISGDAAREGAQRAFAKAPTVLGDILMDEQVSPRHRIEAARELRQTIGDDPDTASKAGERFVITIDLGGDDKLIIDKAMAPNKPSQSDDGEVL